jgi:hypothetical protein
MKKATTAILGIMIVCFFSSGLVRASGTDTLTVYATPNNLEAVINSDTTSSGIQAHGVYKLVSLDTTYIFQGAITVKSNIVVLGVLGTDKRPPCVQPMPLGDGTLPNFMFILNGENTKAVFENLYLTGRSTQNTINTQNYNGAGAIIQVAAKGIRLTVDNVVFDEWPTNNIAYSADNCSIFVTNCKFRNGNVSTAWYSGEAVRNTNNTASSDSIIVKYNTMFCMAYSACCPVTINPVNYLEFSHNNVMYTFKNPFWIFNLTNGKVNDNIFYAAFSGASNKTEHFGMWDQLRSFEVTSVVDFDTLNTPMAQWLDPGDKGDANFMWKAEAKRNIEVRNNVYYWPKAIKDIWTAWNDTAHTDSIITPIWMNTRTNGMFADKTHWPGLTQSGNIEADPQFGSSISDILNSNTGCGDGFIEDFKTVRGENVAKVTTYGYKLENVAGDNWRPVWPLPEVSLMQYANSSLLKAGTDGKDIGDPGWFTSGYTGVQKTVAQLPGKFSLESAYPNPFNPSTTVKFNLAKSGNVSLVIYNIMGQVVKKVVDNVYKNQGEYSYKINMDRLSSGVYFYSLIQADQKITKKMILMK